MRYLYAMGLAWLGLACGSEAASTEDATRLFNKVCAPCHSKDGKAQTPMARKLGVKDLTQSRIADAEIKKQILEGRKGQDGKLAMPAFKEKLLPEEIDALILIVKSFRLRQGQRP